jgi:hypothetical protein
VPEAHHFDDRSARDHDHDDRSAHDHDHDDAYLHTVWRGMYPHRDPLLHGQV